MGTSDAPTSIDKAALFRDLAYEPHTGQLEVHKSIEVGTLATGSGLLHDIGRSWATTVSRGSALRSSRRENPGLKGLGTALVLPWPDIRGVDAGVFSRHADL
jgi:hypothetical protein